MTHPSHSPHSHFLVDGWIMCNVKLIVLVTHSPYHHTPFHIPEKIFLLVDFKESRSFGLDDLNFLTFFKPSSIKSVLFYSHKSVNQSVSTLQIKKGTAINI
jgi:hypothetical protein